MTSRLVAVCIDANDPLALARFWADALRWDVDERADGAVDVVPTDHTSFRVSFLPVPNEKTMPNRLHLDLTTTSVADQLDTAARMVELGAQHIDIGQTPEEAHFVLVDPEGNELCVIHPDNQFLGDCERLGAVNGDGTRAVGAFWSAALDWPLIWDQDEETAIRAPDRTGPIFSWGGPPVGPKPLTNRFHFALAPADDSDLQTELARLESLGATRSATTTATTGATGVVLLDPDGNEFTLLLR